MLSRVCVLLAFALASPAFATPPSPNAAPKPITSVPPSPRAPRTPLPPPWAPRADCSGTYGTPSAEPYQTVSLAALMQNPKAYEGKTLRVQAPIKDVCQKKGCWMVLSEGKDLMRVRFKGYKFFVPTNSKGYIATVVGKAREGTISEGLARHYAEESAHPEEAKKIHGPQKVISFMAYSVRLEKAPSSPHPAKPVSAPNK